MIQIFAFVLGGIFAVASVATPIIQIKQEIEYTKKVRPEKKETSMAKTFEVKKRKIKRNKK